MDLLSPSQKIMLVGHAYTSNLTLSQDATQLELSQYIPQNLATEDGRVVMILYFSDGRPTGTQDHEEWRPIHQAFFETITGGYNWQSTSESRSGSATQSPSRSESRSSSLSPSTSQSLSSSTSASRSSSVSESASPS
jgi:hypothetical protein